MNPRRMKKMASDVVEVSKKQVCKLVRSKSGKAPEKKSLIGADQPLSDCDGGNLSVAAIPKGYVAVYVGAHDRRFVIPTRFLSVPEFKKVMEKAAEEFGYEQEGGLRIPCEEDEFQKLLAVCKLKSKSKSRSFHFHSAHSSHAISISN